MNMIRNSVPIFFDKIFYSVRKVTNTSINTKWYTQGQYFDNKTREYFYYIDHHGQLFLDDSKMKNFTSCFKEKKFLKFFFERIQLNKQKRYDEFPYVSLCGRELNFIRCDDKPIVYTHIVKDKENEFLSYGSTLNDLILVKFEPEKVCMLPSTGRIYHPGPEKVGGIGLLRSALAIEWSKLFIFEKNDFDPPIKFKWHDKVYDLTNELLYKGLT